MQFTYTITEDDDFTPWGDPEIITEQKQKIAAGEWAAYVVTAHADGPVKATAELTGCVVPATYTGRFIDRAQIKDDHLRGVAEELAGQIEATYLDRLITKRDKIDAMIRQMSGS